MPQTFSVPQITEADVAEGISAALAPYSPKEVARAIRKPLETTKAWSAAERCPHTANTINLARSYPSVNGWLAEQCGWTREAMSNSPDAIIRWAVEFRSDPGVDGDLARAILAEAARVKK